MSRGENDGRGRVVSSRTGLRPAQRPYLAQAHLRQYSTEQEGQLHIERAGGTRLGKLTRRTVERLSRSKGDGGRSKLGRVVAVRFERRQLVRICLRARSRSHPCVSQGRSARLYSHRAPTGATEVGRRTRPVEI